MTSPIVTELRRLSPHAPRLAAPAQPVQRAPAATRRPAVATAAGRS